MENTKKTKTVFDWPLFILCLCLGGVFGITLLFFNFYTKEVEVEEEECKAQQKVVF